MQGFVGKGLILQVLFYISPLFFDISNKPQIWSLKFLCRLLRFLGAIPVVPPAAAEPLHDAFHATAGSLPPPSGHLKGNIDK